MFDFLFKRKKSAAAAPGGKAATTMPVPTVAVPSAATLRQQAIEQAAAVAGDEAAAVRFILASGVAEARLVAAQAIHAKRHLEQVYKATRETDRRVARLMQQRLAMLTQQDLAAQRAEAVLAQAQSLDATPALRANQVVSLEREWESIETPPPAAMAAFVAAHAKLEQRLQAQAALQRRVLDQIAHLNAIVADPEAAPAAIVEAAEAADSTLAAATLDTEMPSLPKQLLPELSRLHAHLQQACKALEAVAAGIAAREAALDAWEAQATVAAQPAPLASIAGDIAEAADTSVTLDTFITANAFETESEGVDHADTPLSFKAPVTPPSAAAAQAMPTVAALQQAWRAFPAVVDPLSMGPLQQRFDILLARLKPIPASPPASKIRNFSKSSVSLADSGHALIQTPMPDSTVTRNSDTEAQRQQRAAALEALQSALDEGALQRAMEQDRLLRSLDQEGGRPMAAQQTALTTARAELGRLQGWARWGGAVSREELLAAVEALPAQQLAIAELAKKVGSMRERWRGLDASAGAAPRPLWQRFDAACTSAYAPVAEHFAVLAQERAANAVKAHALIDEVTAFVQGTGLSAEPADAPDWRALAAFSQRVRGLWQRLGPLERREQKRLDAAFMQALQPLAAQLAARQQTELSAREALIAEVTALPPQARDTPERLQAVQVRWQQAAKAFSLTRQEEQACWQRFRSACDTVFTERKTAGAAADAQRNAGLLQKQELCAVLERCLSGVAITAAERAVLLRDTRALWAAAGPVPRAAQAALQTRFDAAVQAIEANRLAGQQAVARQHAEAICVRLALCQEGERLLLAGDRDAIDTLNARWLQLPVLKDELDAVLRTRFDAVVAAASAGDQVHVHLLQENQTPRDAALLRLEVDCALESPPAFLRERLALQVAGLQSTFRSASAGHEQSTRARVAQLCALPAVADPIAVQRIARIIGAMYAAG